MHIYIYIYIYGLRPGGGSAPSAVADAQIAVNESLLCCWFLQQLLATNKIKPTYRPILATKTTYKSFIDWLSVDFLPNININGIIAHLKSDDSLYYRHSNNWENIQNYTYKFKGFPEINCSLTAGLVFCRLTNLFNTWFDTFARPSAFLRGRAAIGQFLRLVRCCVVRYSLNRGLGNRGFRNRGIAPWAHAKTCV